VNVERFQVSVSASNEDANLFHDFGDGFPAEMAAEVHQMAVAS